MNRFAANHPEDWESRLDALTEASDRIRKERQEHPSLDPCSRCDGEGEIVFNPSWPDPQTEDYATCPECGGSGVGDG